MNRIGFVGLGIMGLPMAVNLVKKSGKAVIGFDVFPEQRELLKREGGQTAENASEIFAECDVIFLCLPTNELLQDNVEQIMEVAGPGTVIVDLGSTSPGVIRELYPKVREQSLHLLDSPVSGGETGAIAGTLVLMCGGNQEVFDSVRPLLLYMGTKVTYIGGSGCGCVAKLANNMIVGVNLASTAEAFAFAVKAGINPQILFDAIRDGFAGSAVMDLKIPKIISRDYAASARVAVHQKDLKNATQLAWEMGVEIPLSQMTLEYMNELEAMGKINEDQCAVARIYERNMNVEIK